MRPTGVSAGALSGSCIGSLVTKTLSRTSWLVLLFHQLVQKSHGLFCVLGQKGMRFIDGFIEVVYSLDLEVIRSGTGGTR